MIELNWIKEIKIGMRYIFVHEALGEQQQKKISSDFMQNQNDEIVFLNLVTLIC